ncbi:MAG: hypothetical protein IKO22_07050 [Oscillospiraceae bacterium]|nr:hypothetical protein [Oscillospiraceae bacterium]
MEATQKPAFLLDIRAVEPEDVGGGIGGCLAEVRWHKTVEIRSGEEELLRLGALRMAAAGLLPDGAGLRLQAEGLEKPMVWELRPGEPLRVSLTVPSEDAYDDEAQYTFLLLPTEDQDTAQKDARKGESDQ